ncbi:MAG: T9SS type A sorting domain-containing protein [candidate division WOR-3 bacterium]
MKRLLSALLLLGAVSGLGAQYQVGDSLPIYLDNARLQYQRDTTPWWGHVLYAGPNSYGVVIYERIFEDPGHPGDTIHIWVDTARAESLAVALAQKFESEIRPQVLSFWQAEGLIPSEKVYIVVAPIWFSEPADVWKNAPGLWPLFGYFNPKDLDTTYEYSNKKPMLIITYPRKHNAAAELFAIPSKFGVYENYLRYLFGKYVLYRLDPREEAISLLGMAMYSAYKTAPDTMKPYIMCGFTKYPDVSKNHWRFYGIVLCSDTAPQHSNSYLYQINPLWPNPVEGTEIERERMLTWWMFLEEKLGEDYLKSVGRDSLYRARSQTEYALYANGLVMPKAVEEWGLKVTLHGRVHDYDFEGFTPDRMIFAVPGTIMLSKSKDEQKNQFGYCALIYRISPAPAGVNFEGDDDNKIVIEGDTVPGWALYLVDTTTNSVTPIELDEHNHAYFQMEEKHYLVVINRNKTGFYMWIKGNSDTQGPALDDTLYTLYTIQNPVYLRKATCYLVSPEPLYNDAAPGDTFPVVTVFAADTADTLYPPISKDIKLVGLAGGSTDKIYAGEVSLMLYDAFGTLYTGDVLIQVTKAYDRNGNPATTLPSDVATVLSIPSEGGDWPILGGTARITVPPGAFSYGTILVATESRASDIWLSPKAEGRVFVLAASEGTILRPVRVEFPAEGTSGVYRLDNGRWVSLDSYMSVDGTRLVAWTDRMGTFLVGKPGSGIPGEFSFYAPSVIRPGEARLYLSLPERSSVSLSVYDITGKKIVDVYEGEIDAGQVYLSWDASKAPSGVYFYRLRVNNKAYTAKLVISR